MFKRQTSNISYTLIIHFHKRQLVTFNLQFLIEKKNYHVHGVTHEVFTCEFSPNLVSNANTNIKLKTFGEFEKKLSIVSQTVSELQCFPVRVWQD